MKLKKLIKVLHPDTVVALVNYESEMIIIKISKLNSELKERQVKMLYPARNDNAYDLYIELKS